LLDTLKRRPGQSALAERLTRLDSAARTRLEWELSNVDFDLLERLIEFHAGHPPRRLPSGYVPPPGCS
jgi:hypothetical protein